MCQIWFLGPVLSSAGCPSNKVCLGLVGPLVSLDVIGQAGTVAQMVA